MHDEPKPVDPKTVQVNYDAELAAIRTRLAFRRKQMLSGGASLAERQFNSTDLADAEWLVIELSRAKGVTIISMDDEDNYQRLTKLRYDGLNPAQKAVLDRIQGLHGELNPGEMVELDYLHMQQDKLLTADELAEWKRLEAMHTNPKVATP